LLNVKLLAHHVTGRLSKVKLGLVDVSSVLQPLLVQYTRIYTRVAVIVVDLQYLTKYVYGQTPPIAIGRVSLEIVRCGIRKLISLLCREKNT
jgi:hypothetical protein